MEANRNLLRATGLVAVLTILAARAALAGAPVPEIPSEPRDSAVPVVRTAVGGDENESVNARLREAARKAYPGELTEDELRS